MDKKKIIKITIWAICILVFICWMVVAGGELKDLKAIDEDYEVSVTVMEKHPVGYTDDTVKKTVYEFTGEGCSTLQGYPYKRNQSQEIVWR